MVDEMRSRAYDDVDLDARCGNAMQTETGTLMRAKELGSKGMSMSKTSESVTLCA